MLWKGAKSKPKTVKHSSSNCKRNYMHCEPLRNNGKKKRKIVSTHWKKKSPRGTVPLQVSLMIVHFVHPLSIIFSPSVLYSKYRKTAWTLIVIFFHFSRSFLFCFFFSSKICLGLEAALKDNEHQHATVVKEQEDQYLLALDQAKQEQKATGKEVELLKEEVERLRQELEELRISSMQQQEQDGTLVLRCLTCVSFDKCIVWQLHFWQ